MGKVWRLALASLILMGVAAPAWGVAAQERNAGEIKVIKYQAEDYFVPRVSGMTDSQLQDKINQTLWGIISSLDGPAHYTHLAGDFEVSFYNEKVLGIHFRGMSYTQRAAHPANLDFGLHIDMTTGRVYELADLFRPGVDYDRQIQDLCRANQAAYRLKIAGLWDGWTEETFASTWKKGWADEQFLLSADAVRLYTMPASVTGYISGYSVPYRAMEDLINREGELYKALVAHAPVAIAVELEKIGYDDLIVRELGVMPEDNAAWALTKMGEPKSMTQVPEGLSRDYGDFKVITNADKITSISTDNSRIGTRRWVHCGQSLELVKKRYGEPDGVSAAGGYDFYEYNYSPNTYGFVLQFAVKQGTDKVSSISWRITKP